MSTLDHNFNDIASKWDKSKADAPKYPPPFSIRFTFEERARLDADRGRKALDAAKMKAINLPHFKLKLTELSRQIYLEQGWNIPRGLEDFADRDPLNYSQAEAQQAKRVKRDAWALKAMFQKYWAGSDSRVAFAHALKEQGFALARGDRRGFVAVDAAGEVYGSGTMDHHPSYVAMTRHRDEKRLYGEPKALRRLECNYDNEAERSALHLDHRYKRSGPRR